jgi:hypothetical protein
MRDLAFVAFLAACSAFGLKRPFLFVLAYVYVDIGLAAAPVLFPAEQPCRCR